MQMQHTVMPIWELPLQLLVACRRCFMWRCMRRWDSPAWPLSCFGGAVCCLPGGVAASNRVRCLGQCTSCVCPNRLALQLCAGLIHPGTARSLFGHPDCPQTSTAPVACVAESWVHAPGKPNGTVSSTVIIDNYSLTVVPYGRALVANDHTCADTQALSQQHCTPDTQSWSSTAHLDSPASRLLEVSAHHKLHHNNAPRSAYRPAKPTVSFWPLADGAKPTHS